MKSEYYLQSIERGKQFQLENKAWAGFDIVKYQKQIKDLVIRYGAKTILDYGCGKGNQYTEKLSYDYEVQTFDEWLGVEVYKYDPCVEEFSVPPPDGTKFDGVICSQVLGSIPHNDLDWVAKELESYSDKFCFISLNFKRPPKSKKRIYDSNYFHHNRTRKYFKSFFTEWKESDLFWWFKDRPYYDKWADDQLDNTWKDIPDTWVNDYVFVKSI
jgi:hypothetical protein